jgi:membrane protein
LDGKKTTKRGKPGFTVTKFERLILKMPLFAFTIRKSKHIIIPGFSGIPIYYVIRFFLQQINKVGLNERAAAISFNLIQALPAAFLFIFSIIPYLPEQLNIKGQILNLFKDLAPSTPTYKLIEGMVNDLLKKHVGVFSFGFVLVMYYSSNALIGIIRTFDSSISEKKGYFLHTRWRAIKLTLILILLLFVSLIAMIGQEELASILKEVFLMKQKAYIPGWNVLRWLTIIALIFFGISIIYKYAPSVNKRWDIISPGSILATTLTLATTISFSYWVTHFGNYNKVYGSIGTILIIMLLLFLNSMILLIGFELNVSLTFLKAEVEKKEIAEKEAMLG